MPHSFSQERGIRFEDGLSGEVKANFLQRVDSADREILSGKVITILRPFPLDPLCFLEHLTLGSSAPPLHDPLAPYAFLSKKLSAQEISSARRERFEIGPPEITGFFNVHNLDAEFRKTPPFSKLDEERGSSKEVTLTVDPDIAAHFRKFCESVGNSGADTDSGIVTFTFLPAVFNEHVGRIQLPTIKSVGSWPQESGLPTEFVGKIRLRDFYVTWLSRILKASVFIDQEGWRVQREYEWIYKS